MEYSANTRTIEMYKRYIANIIEASKRDKSQNPFYEKNKFGGVPKVRTDILAIGNELNELGGYDAMLEVANYIRVNYKSSHARELEFAWNGIGRWQS